MARRPRLSLGVVVAAALLASECYGFLPATPGSCVSQGARLSTLSRRSAVESGKEEVGGAGTGFGAPSTKRSAGAKTGTVNKRLLNVIDAELKEVRSRMPEAPPQEEDGPEDLNGINPLTPLSSAAFAGFVSFLFWRITIGLATALNNVHLETDFYPAQRLFNIASTAFVGITALGAGVIGVTAVGLLGLSMRVSLGIMSGELDPNKKREEKPRSPIPLDAQGLPKITGAWYDVKPPVQQPPVQAEQQQPQAGGAVEEGEREKQNA